MHRKRLVVAVILLPCLYLSVMYLPERYFSLLLLGMSTIALSEFYHMYRVSGILKYACLLLGIVIVGTAHMNQHRMLDVFAAAVMIVMALRLFSGRDPASSLADISRPVVGLLYVPLLFSFQAKLRQFGPEWIIFLYASVWASDSMAYYIGKGIGKRKLYKAVSPNKTVAGAVGSLIGGVAGGVLLRALIVPQLSLPAALLIGMMIGSISIVGDLIESMFKRDAGVKDSSHIIPGHGGILDKVDGALFTGPLLYWTLSLYGIQ